ncbi:MAG: sugar phosphate nucleotidyltransferase [Patescibacteria group bacterium]|nr:sugar phosphate nucleotidyltransferase [Patescibacteria group bacterium]
MKVIILAGGGGTRLWPVSRKKSPKQSQKILGQETLLQKTFKRLKKGLNLNSIYISTGQDYYQEVKKQIPALKKSQYILEPQAKNTAAAIGLAACILHKKNPEEIMVMANADHYIDKEAEYIRVLKTAEKAVQKYPNQTVLIGLKPEYPETGYGYIKFSSLKDKIGKYKIYQGDRFVEKPDHKKAKQYIKKGHYLWNPAMFCWRVEHLLNLFKKHLPAHYQSLMKIQKARGTKKEKSTLEKEFKKMKNISIDFGLMEKIKKMLVIPASFGWIDVGSWRSVKEILSKNPGENVIRGNHIGVDTKGTMVYNLSQQLIATAGVEDMIIINTSDAILVCPLDQAQKVKKIVARLKKQNKNKYL